MCTNTPICDCVAACRDRGVLKSQPARLSPATSAAFNNRVLCFKSQCNLVLFKQLHKFDFANLLKNAHVP